MSATYWAVVFVCLIVSGIAIWLDHDNRRDR